MYILISVNNINNIVDITLKSVFILCVLFTKSGNKLLPNMQTPCSPLFYVVYWISPQWTSRCASLDVKIRTI